MKNLLKSVYYAVKPGDLHPEMQLRMGYIFHTEAIQDPTFWPMLKRFCLEYKKVTGAAPICTMMTPENARIAKQMKDFGVSNEEYVARTEELATMAIIGHHGHYYKNPADYASREGEIRSDNYSREQMTDQFYNDLNWFRKHHIDHNGLYAGGWWFMHRDLIELLIAENYRADFSFTYSPVFGHQWSKGVMQQGGIRFGQNFRLGNAQGNISLIQNLIGCHNTPFVEDFNRHMNALFNSEQPQVTGVVNTHDFNLDTNYDYTFKVLRYLAKQPNVSFWGRKELDQMTADSNLVTLEL